MATKESTLSITPSAPDDDLDDRGPVAVAGAPLAWLGEFRSARGQFHGRRGAAEAAATVETRAALAGLIEDIRARLNLVRALAAEHQAELDLIERELLTVPRASAEVHAAATAADTCWRDVKRAIAGSLHLLEEGLGQVEQMTAAELIDRGDRHAREAARLTLGAPMAIEAGMGRLRELMGDLARKIRRAPVVLGQATAIVEPPDPPRQRVAHGVTGGGR